MSNEPCRRPLPPANPNLEPAAQRIAAARKGDRRALAALLVETAAQVRSSLTISPQWQSVLDLDDVMQVTFMESLLRFDQFAGDTPVAFVAWVRQIARNNLLSAVRALGAEKRPQPRRRVPAGRDGDSYTDLCALLGVTSTTPSRVLGQREAREAIETALTQLPPDYAAVIRTMDLEGCSGPEAAQRLGRSRGAVFMMLARSRDRLRDLLGSSSRFFST